MKKCIFTIVIASLFIGCSKKDGGDLGPYYELTYRDSALAVVIGDTIHVVVTQMPSGRLVKDTIPFDLKYNADLLDTIKLEFEVKFGSYSSIPNPQKERLVQHDTLFLWYTSQLSRRSVYKPSSPFGVSQIETSPKLEYYSIQSISINVSPTKQCTFYSQLWK